MIFDPVSRKVNVLERALEVCRFLLRERDLPNLLQGVCNLLLRDRLYRRAWIALFDQESGNIISAEAGLGKQFTRIREQLRQGVLPACGERALEHPHQPVVCGRCDCGLLQARDKTSETAVALALGCSMPLVGFMVVQPPGNVDILSFEQQQLAHLATSIGTALDQLVTMEALRRRQQKLQVMEERFELALHASNAGLWDWNIKTGEMFTSPDRYYRLDYRSDGAGMAAASWQGRIHPEDRDRVIQNLNEHLTGKTEEYRIEYRVKGKDGSWEWFLDRGRVVERDELHMPLRMTGTHQNITRQKKQEEALVLVQEQFNQAIENERAFLQTVINSAGDPVMAIDTDYRILLINQTAGQMLHVDDPLEKVRGQHCYRLFHGLDAPCENSCCPCPVQLVAKKNDRVTLVHETYHCNDIQNVFEIDVSPLRDNQGELRGIIEVGRDITDRQRIEQELRESQSRFYRLAHHDSLTGLPNRLLFQDRLEQALHKARRNHRRVAILFLDLDKFKHINDTLGHDVGDALLVEVARRLKKLCRRSDTVARLGGDEFVFILDDIKSRANGAMVAEKIMNSLAQPIEAGGHSLHISTSIGVALFPDDSEDMDDVVRCADMALYQAKSEGRSNYQLYHPGMQLPRDRREFQEEQLRTALAQQEFVLHYQPQYDIATGRLVGLEALLRWQHPREGLMAPDKFLPLAEEVGLMVAIGQWVFSEVCRQVVAWQQQGKMVVPIAVNVSSRQFREHDFVNSLVRSIREFAVDPSLLEIELTEATVMDKAEPSILELQQISRLGISLAVDDFGSGRFSLARLHQLPLSRLKIDRSFINGIEKDHNLGIVVDAIIVLAHNLGLQVLAEGVEQQTQLQFLEGHQCDQVQGFYFSPPVPPEEAVKLLDGT